MNRGFTLVELVMVVAVMGIIAAVGIPMLHSSLNEADLAAAASEVASALKYARIVAARTDRSCQVTIDATTDTLAVKQITYDAAVLDPSSAVVARSQAGLVGYQVVWHPVRRGFRYRVGFADEHRFGGVDVAGASFGGSGTVTFDEFGKPSSGGTVDLARGGRQVTVTLDGATGETSVTY